MSNDTSVPFAPRALPLLGHAVTLARDPLGLLCSLPPLGRLVGLRIGPRPVVVVCDPSLIRQVLQDDRTYAKGGPLFERVGEFLGNGLITCPHDQHRRQRRLCQPSFRSERLPGYADTTVAAAVEGAEGWHGGRIIDPMRELMVVTAHATAQTMFSTALSPRERHAFVDDMNVVLEGIFRRMITPPTLEAVPTRRGRRYAAALERIRRTAGRIIALRREDPTDHGDLLSSLLAAVDPEQTDGPQRRRLDDAELVDEVLTFFAAGTETTAVTLSWALDLLARHPEVESAVHEEVDRVLAGAHPTHADLAGLEVVGRVVTETLRMYPPTWILTRAVDRETELAGVRLPAGTTLAFSPYLIHRRPELYPDPDRFDPDRWIGVRPDRAHYLPFGAGPRRCIGDRLALVQAPLILAVIAARRRLLPVDHRPPRPSLRATLSPHRLRMRVVLRDPAPAGHSSGGQEEVST